MGHHFFLDAVFEKVEGEGVVFLLNPGDGLLGVDVFQGLQDPFSPELLVLFDDHFLDLLLSEISRKTVPVLVPCHSNLLLLYQIELLSIHLLQWPNNGP